MGHLRLGALPKTREWDAVVAKLQTGADVANLAAATALAAEQALESAKADPGLGYAVWLLTQLPLAARSEEFAGRLVKLGFSAGAGQSLLALTSEFALALDKQVAGRAHRTDLGEMARLAAMETLTAAIGPRLPTLFTDAGDVRAELSRLATKAQFGALARDFFARLTNRTLEYYLSRELPNHVGPGRTFANLAEQTEFRSAMVRHCDEVSLIVEEFAGGWFSKSVFNRTLSPETAQGFAAYSLKKLRDELRARGGGDA
ncbi:MAG: hypothetical protein ACOYLQ_20025 [Hyphomicrobiaceae bacterium]